MSPRKKDAVAATGVDAGEVIEWLRATGTQATRDGMARYAIPSDRAFGVPIGALRDRAKILGKSHELAEALWDSGWYEARMLAAFVGEPARVTGEQMDRWRADFDNWAVGDHVCFHLFDRTADAWPKVAEWARLEPEHQKRAAFALLWALALHDKKAPEERFLDALPLIEDAASDDRNFVKKGVDMALRAVARRGPKVRAAVVDLAHRLAATDEPSARWIGRSTLRELEGASSKKGKP
jgi:3-methyladenine DNA glycosylase AlkD